MIFIGAGPRVISSEHWPNHARLIMCRHLQFGKLLEAFERTRLALVVQLAEFRLSTAKPPWQRSMKPPQAIVLEVRIPRVLRSCRRFLNPRHL